MRPRFFFVVVRVSLPYIERKSLTKAGSARPFACRSCCTDIITFIVSKNHGSREGVVFIVTGLLTGILRNGSSIHVRGNISIRILGSPSLLRELFRRGL